MGETQFRTYNTVMEFQCLGASLRLCKEHPTICVTFFEHFDKENMQLNAFFNNVLVYIDALNIGSENYLVDCFKRSIYSKIDNPKFLYIMPRNRENTSFDIKTNCQLTPAKPYNLYEHFIVDDAKLNLDIGHLDPNIIYFETPESCWQFDAESQKFECVYNSTLTLLVDQVLKLPEHCGLENICILSDLCKFSEIVLPEFDKKTGMLTLSSYPHLRLQNSQSDQQISRYFAQLLLVDDEVRVYNPKFKYIDFDAKGIVVKFYQIKDYCAFELLKERYYQICHENRYSRIRAECRLIQNERKAALAQLK